MATVKLNPKLESALREFASIHGKGWKDTLCVYWANGRDANALPNDQGCYLRAIRNTFGPSWLHSTDFEFD